MRVFMLGWEFPPFISGGLGTACYGLTKAMSQLGTDVLFVLPRPVTTPFSTHVTLVSPAQAGPGSSGGGSSTTTSTTTSTEFHLDEFEHVTFKAVEANLTSPYNTPADYKKPDVVAQRHKSSAAREVTSTTTTTERVGHGNTTEHGQASAAASGEIKSKPVGHLGGNSHSGGGDHYGGDLFTEIQRYAAMASEIARNEDFDVVHAHDWMTYAAGLAVSAIKGKPLVVHVHSTEFDRSGQNIDTRIYDIERRGMHGAMKVIAVSYLTKNICTRHYGVDPSKVEVVYNAIEAQNGSFDEEKYSIHKDEKIVLFLGRITMQKGPEYFLAAAKKVLEVMENVKFVMAGSGDMVRRTIEMAAAMGIGHKVLFTGFLRGPDVEKVFKMADLYVMPSVSEPFGIAPLEAMSHDVPVIISKQSGVSEVLSHALKVDFWDINEMANKIIAVLRHPPLSQTLRQHGNFEVRRMSWQDSAQGCTKVYEEMVGLAAKV
jgi:glycosyltransferase involved in cell wall biosynthesis